MTRNSRNEPEKKGIINKFFDLIGLEEEIVEDGEEEGAGSAREEIEKNEPWRRSASAEKTKVLSLYTQKQQKVVVIEPVAFNDVEVIANHLRNKHPVIVNLENVEKSLARRIVDFISGAVFALDGFMQRISYGIFLFTPNNMDIAVEQIREQMETKNPYSRDFDFRNK
ncbi:MAG: cell division protein SepF [Bacillota bacterium]